MNIWAVAKDPGGLSVVLPVVKALRSAGHNVLLFANGKAIELLEKMNLDAYIPCVSAEEVLGTYMPHTRLSALITSMCSGGGVGRELVPMLRGVCPTIAIQDYWGARLATDWKYKRYRPDFICVNDKVAKDIVLRAWPDYDASQVKVTGSPAFDKYAGYDAQAEGTRTREKLGIPREAYVIVYGGQLKNSALVLAELLRALKQISGGLENTFFLLPRMHPRMKDDAPQEIAQWNKVLENRGAISVLDSSVCTTQEVIATTKYRGAVVSMYSTMLVEAALVHATPIAVLYPNVGMKQFIEETGGIMTEVPFVELGCVAKATTPRTLMTLLSATFFGTLRERLAEKSDQHLQIANFNADRVVRLVMEIATL